MLHPRFGNSSHSSGARSVHSSEYARTAYGPRIGSITPQVFSDRLSVERNRQVVNSYRNSKIGAVSPHAIDKASSGIRRGSDTAAQSGSSSRFDRQSRLDSTINATKPRHQSFNEPAGRNYNPFN